MFYGDLPSKTYGTVSSRATRSLSAIHCYRVFHELWTSQKEAISYIFVIKKSTHWHGSCSERLLSSECL